MKIFQTIIVLFIFAFGAGITSCGNNNQQKAANTDSAGKVKMPKMSAKERLAKNNNLEKHLSWERKGLKGKVKKMTAITYELPVSGGKEQQKMMEKNVDTFDARGNLAGYAYYDKAGKQTLKTAIMFDTHDNDTLRISYGADGKAAGHTVVTYDQRGNQTGSIEYDSAGKEQGHKEVFKYDEKDNLIEMIFYNEQNTKVTYRSVYTFDDNGFRTGSESFDSLGKIVVKSSSVFDEKGNYLHGNYTTAGEGTYYDTCTYDKEGRIAERIERNSEGKTGYRSSYRYDEKGNPSERMDYDKDGKPTDKNEYYTYEYDATGNVTKKTTFVMKGGKKEMQYEYY